MRSPDSPKTSKPVPVTLAVGQNLLTDVALPAGISALGQLATAVCQVVSVVAWRTAPDWSIAARRCSDTLLFASLAGEVEVMISGTWHTVLPGHLVIIPTGVMHRARYRSACRRWEVIAMHVVLTNAYGRDLWAGFTQAVHAIDTQAWVMTTTAHNRGHVNDVEAIIRHGFADLVLRGAAYAVPQAPDARIAAALARLEASPSATIDELAQAAHLGHAHFRTLFRQVTGSSPKSYQQRLRIERACRWLCTTPEPVQAIAAELGFGSDDHFHRAFKTALGMTPSAYRATSGM